MDFVVVVVLWFLLCRTVEVLLLLLWLWAALEGGLSATLEYNGAEADVVVPVALLRCWRLLDDDMAFNLI